MTNIGIFDSGLGGLTVLSELVKYNKANYFYFGDSKRAPYGTRTKEEIIELAEEIVDFLETHDIDYYVIACNTISVLATNILKEKYGKEFYPISLAGIDAASNYEGDFFVLATRATVNSHLYKDILESMKGSRVYEQEGSLLVELVEAGEIDGDQVDEALEGYLRLANDKKIPNIILACTHFPFLTDAIVKNLSYEANIINPAKSIADKIETKGDVNKVKIYLSAINDKSKALIDSLIDCDYELILKEL